MKIFLFFLVCTFFFFSCEDDDRPNPQQVPPRLLADQTIEDNAEIQNYLETHFYNYEEFDNPPEDFDFRIRIDTIAGENSDKTPLSRQVSTAVVNVSSSNFRLLQEEEIDVPHTYHFLEVRPGGGPNPTLADSTLIKFEGSLLNGTVFDASPNFVWQQLPFMLRGYANFMVQLKAGTEDGIVAFPDGTTTITNSGLGLVVMPSGLAYFNEPPNSTIPLYAPLVFSVELGLFVENTDTDNDGVPSIEEDLNDDGDLFNDNTDRDFEIENRLSLIANFLDTDDDGDGIPTRDEISDAAGNIIFPYPDDNNNGIPDYLDADFQRQVPEN